MNADLSVVMPVGRVDGEFTHALDALRAQTTTFPFSIVLSLNTPDAGERTKLDAALAEVADERIVVIDSSDQRGAAHARNVGARASDTAIIAFTDSDDEVEAGWLQNLFDGLASFDAVSGFVSETKFSTAEQQAWRPPATPDGLPTFLGVPYLLSGNLAIQRKAFEAVGGFDTSLKRCEDLAISWALIKAGFTLGFVPDAVLHYRHRPGLIPMMRQHYYYGVGMSQVLVRSGVPTVPGAAQGRSAMFKPNGKAAQKRTVAWVLRRGSIAAGRLSGLVTESIRKIRH